MIKLVLRQQITWNKTLLKLFPPTVLERQRSEYMIAVKYFQALAAKAEAGYCKRNDR
jgi:hypothetical protein